MCGPTGVGFLYGKGELLSKMDPFLGRFLFILVYYKLGWEDPYLFVLMGNAT